MGFAALSGCAENGEDEATVTSTPGEVEFTEATPTPAESRVVVRDHELVADEGEFTTDVYVAATVENAGDAPSGRIVLTAKWYDADGSYRNVDKQALQSLGPGERWAARVYYLGVDSGSVADYELDSAYEVEPPRTNPEGLEIVESEMDVGEGEIALRGTVENARDETVPHVRATGTVYDGDGDAMGDEWTNAADLSAGETWSFELRCRGRERIARATDHEIWITDSPL